MDGLSNTNIFLHSFGDYKSKTRELARLVSHFSSPLGCREPPSWGMLTGPLCECREKKERERTSWCFFLEGHLCYWISAPSLWPQLTLKWFVILIQSHARPELQHTNCCGVCVWRGGSVVHSTAAYYLRICWIEALIP